MTRNIVQKLRLFFFCLLVFGLSFSLFPLARAQAADWASENVSTVEIVADDYDANCSQTTGLCDFFDKQGGRLYLEAGDTHVGFWGGSRAFDRYREDIYNVEDSWEDRSDNVPDSSTLTVNGSTATLVFQQTGTDVSFATTYTFNEHDSQVLVNGQITYLADKKVVTESIRTGIEDDFTETALDPFDPLTLSDSVQLDAMDSATGWTTGGVATVAATTTPAYVKEGSASLALTLTDDADASSDQANLIKTFSATNTASRQYLSFDFFPTRRMKFFVYLYSGSDSNYRYLQTRWLPGDGTWKNFHWDFKNTWSAQVGSFNPDAITKIMILSYDNNNSFPSGAVTYLYLDNLRLSGDIAGGDFDMGANPYLGTWHCSSGDWYVDTTAANQGGGALKWTGANFSSQANCQQYTSLEEVGNGTSTPEMLSDISAADYLAADIYSDCASTKVKFGLGDSAGASYDGAVEMDVPANRWATFKWSFHDDYGQAALINLAQIHKYFAYVTAPNSSCVIRLDNLRIGQYNSANKIFDSGSFAYLESGQSTAFSPRIFRTGDSAFIYGKDFGAEHIELLKRNDATRTIDAYIYEQDMHFFSADTARTSVFTQDVATYYKEVSRALGAESEGTIVYEFAPAAPHEVVKSRWPRAFRAAYSLSEDDLYLGSSRAFYYGTSSSTSPTYGQTGLLAHNLRTSKNVWATDAHWNDAPTLAWFDEAFNDGLEIAMHTPGSTQDTRTVIEPVLSRVAARYGTRQWVDHSITNNHEALAEKGAFPTVDSADNTTSSGLYILDLLNASGFKYGWAETGRGLVNLFGQAYSSGSPLPHRSQVIDEESWTAPFYIFGRVFGDNYVDFVATDGGGDVTSIQDEVIDNRGLELTYTHSHGNTVPVYNAATSYFNQSGSDYTLKSDVDDIFAWLEEKQEAGTLWVNQVSRIFDWLLASDQVTITARTGDTSTVHNGSDQALSGLTLVNQGGNINYAKINDEYQIYVTDADVVLPKLAADAQVEVEINTGTYSTTLPRVSNVSPHFDVDEASYEAATGLVNLVLDYVEPCDTNYATCVVSPALATTTVVNYQRPFWNATSTIDAAGTTTLTNLIAAETTATLSAVALDVVPDSGSVAVVVSTWNTSGDYAKAWTETGSAADVVTTHTVGDLVPGSYYVVSYTHDADPAVVLATLQADGDGQITFEYSAGYSSVAFSVLADGTNPAAFALLAPSNRWTINSNSATVTFSWSASTDSESALDKYQLFINGALSQDNLASTTLTTTATLDCGQDYTWYVKAIDRNANASVTASRQFQISCPSGVSGSRRVSTVAKPAVTAPARLPTVAPAATPALGAFSQPLSFNQTHPDVRRLQAFLNAHGFPVASAGPGAPGQETNYFGRLTQQALGRFQLQNQLIATSADPAFGYLGPKTRALISAWK